MFSRKLFHNLLIPGGLLLPAAIFLQFWNQRPDMVEKALELLPHATLFLGVFIGWRFNCSRLILALLAMGLAERALQLSRTLQDGDLVFAAVCFLLPLNLAWIAWIGERGLFSASGLLRISAILFQPVAVDILLRIAPLQTRSALLSDVSLVPIDVWGIPHPFLLAFILTTILLVVRFWMIPNVFEGSLFWVLISCGMALQAGGGVKSTFFLAVSGLILVGAVLESSYFMAYRDELTGLPSRRSLNDFLLRVGNCYTVAMVDIDYFKKVNDTYGHDVGDQMLKMVASRLARVAGGGRAFRYGGEEFSVVFPGRKQKECLPYLEELRKSVANASFTLRAPNRPSKKPRGAKKNPRKRKDLGVTISIGVAANGRRKISAEEVIKAADQCLYRAKEAGRNQVYSLGD